jgi:hypothetical protein
MNVEWPSRTLKFFAVVAMTVATTAFILSAALLYTATRSGESSSPEQLQRAIALEPSNADYRCRLGRVLWARQLDASASVTHFQAAVQRNPYDAFCWLHLANAYYVLGNFDARDAAIGRALAVAPKMPQVLWQVANFNFIRGQMHEALHQLQLSMHYDDATIDEGVRLAWRATQDADLILAEALPPDLEPHMIFLRMQLARNDVVHALRVWSAANKLGIPITLNRAAPLFNYLVDHQLGTEAAAAWEQFTSSQPSYSSYKSTAKNQLVDGGFEQDILNGGLDWRYDQQPFARVDIDNDVAHSGSRSLSVSYSGTAGDAGIWQPIPVKPNTSYQFTAWTRSDLAGVHGPRLALAPADRAPVLLLDEISGQSDWHRTTGEFTVGLDTHLLYLRLSRPITSTQLRGRLWLDDLTLVEKR